MRTLLVDPDPPTNGGGAVITPEQARANERNRVKSIDECAENFLRLRPEAREKVTALVTEARSSDMDLGTFQVRAMKECLGAKPVEEKTMAKRGIDPRQYSLRRAIASCINRSSKIPDGFEGEVHQEFCRGSSVKPEGFLIPFDTPLPVNFGSAFGQRLLRRARLGRDLQANIFGEGGALVPTETFVPIIEILRNRMKCFDLGVQTLSGLDGNVVIPRQTGAATAYFLPEIQAAAVSTQTLDQISLTPHRTSAVGKYSRQLLLQAAIDVENFVRDDLLKVLAINIDRVILNGAGGNSEPLGIINTNGVGSIVLGGPATWGQIVQFETTVAALNADIGEMAYVTTPTAKGRLKSLAKLPIGATVVATETLWGGMLGDGSDDGEMNGYRAASTNQIPNNVLLFGVFSQAIMGMWGGFDVIVNPYTFDVNAETQITIHAFLDVALRHAQSFCVSADSAAQ